MIHANKTSSATKWKIHLESGDFSAISETIGYLSDALKKRIDDQTLITSRLVYCEELLNEYAEHGYHDIKLQLRRWLGFYSIRIVIPGEMRQPLSGRKINNGEYTGDEIRESIHLQILRNGNAFSDYRYVRNANVFGISLSASEEVIGDKILELYQNEGKTLRKHPMRLSWKITAMDPVRSIAAVVNRIVKRTSLMLMPLCMAAIIDALVQGEPFNSPVIMRNLFFSVILLLVNCICNYHLDLFLYKKRVREVEYGLKSALLKKIQTLSITWLNNTPSGGVFSKIIRDTEGVRMMIIRGFNAAITLTTDIVILLFATTKCPIMLLFFVLTIPISTYLIAAYKKPIRESAEYLRKTTEHSNAVISDMQFMSEMTRLHGVLHTEYNLLNYQLQNVKRAGNEHDKITHKFDTSSFFVFQSFQLLCLAAAVFLASKNVISIGMVVLFRSYFDALINSVTQAIEAIPEVSEGMESLRSLNEILCCDALEPDGDTVFSNPIRGEIEFKDVTFRYPENVTPTIDHLSFTIPDGKSAAIIGSSGSGKTTIMNLITGLLQADSGEILIDGVPMKEIRKSSFRRQIAVVPQNTTLFAGTLWENLVYGQSFSTYSEVMDVLEKIGMKEFVDNLPGGLDAEVKENGANFSGGQKQRISIARALLRKPRLLLFDEATSSLDEASEKQVQNAINAMMGQCTMVIIAHRLSTIRNCDLIFRLNTDKGIDVFHSYDELMNTNE